MISPLRLLRLGLHTEDVCALYGLTPEQLDQMAEDAEYRKTQAANAAQTRQGCLMTKVLERPDVSRWAFQTIMRRK